MSDTAKDAFELPEEDFAQAIANPETIDVPEEHGPEEQPGMQQELPETEPKEQETAPEPETTPDPVETKLTKIVHKGQAHELTEDKLIELAQKGFDYESKVTAIASDRRLVELVKSNPELQGVVNEWVEKKLNPEPDVNVPDISQYEDANAWAKDLIKQNQPKPQQQQFSPVRDMAAQARTVLMSRDPENFGRVMSAFPQYLAKLTGEQVNAVGSDLGMLVKFYDKVKKATEPKPPTPQPKATFRAKPGGGEPDRTPKQKNAWDLPNKDFEQVIAKVKGY